MKRNNKILYESIMRNVSKSVKKTLNESLSDKNIAYVSSPIESIYEIGKEIRNVLERSEYLYQTMNETVSPHIKPCIVFTFKNDYFYNPVDIVNKVIMPDQGYCFVTESNCVVLALYLDKIKNKYQRKLIELLVLGVLTNLFIDAYSDIEYYIYFGVHIIGADKINDKNISRHPFEDEEYPTIIDLLKEQFGDTINMDGGRLICVRTDDESYNKFVNVANLLKEQ